MWKEPPGSEWACLARGGAALTGLPQGPSPGPGACAPGYFLPPPWGSDPAVAPGESPEGAAHENKELFLGRLLGCEIRVGRDTVPAYRLVPRQEYNQPAGWLMSRGRTVGRLCEPARENS